MLTLRRAPSHSCRTHMGEACDRTSRNSQHTARVGHDDAKTPRSRRRVVVCCVTGSPRLSTMYTARLPLPTPHDSIHDDRRVCAHKPLPCVPITVLTTVCAIPYPLTANHTIYDVKVMSPRVCCMSPVRCRAVGARSLRISATDSGSQKVQHCFSGFKH